MINSKLKNTIAILFFISALLSFISPIVDGDFAWHLKTGEYIYQHGEIPKTDPFSIVAAGDMFARFILSQYWLAQVIFYIFFTLTGPVSIILMRSLLLTGIIVILWYFMKETPILVKIGILYLAATLFLNYATDRPQLFSFFFAAVVIALLENFKKFSSIKSILFIPLLMLLWANLHGGYIFGNITIVIYCLSEAVKYFFLRKYSGSLSEDKLLPLVAIGLISILVSYLNPNTYRALTITLATMNNYANMIREYLPPLKETAGPFVNKNDFIFWAIVGYSLVLLVLNLRRLDLTHLAMIFFALYISLSAVRFLPFYVITGLLISGQYGFNIVNFENFTRLKKLKFLAAAVSLILVLCWCGSLVRPVYRSLRYFKELPETRLYPKRATQFLLNNVEGGNIFCSYNIGSYLLYRLYPKFKTFVDARGLSYKTTVETEAIESAERWNGDQYSLIDAISDVLPKEYGRVEFKLGKRPAHLPVKERWLTLLDTHNIDIIVHEACNVYTGMLYTFAIRMVTNDQWKLVYLDGKEMIFVRDIPKFKDLIAKYNLDKGKIYDEIGMENVSGIGISNHHQLYSALAFALLMKGASDESVEEYIRHALYLDSKETIANYLEAYLALKKKAGKITPPRLPSGKN